MAIYGIGSYAEPIVVSDEEDATLVENELNRWNQSPSSSNYEYSTAHEVATPSIPHVPPQPASPKSFQFSSQKRKRQEPRMSHTANPGKESKRARKQNTRKDTNGHSSQPRAGPSSLGMHRQFTRMGLGGWSEDDFSYSSQAAPPTVSTRYPHARPFASPAAPSMSTYWSSDVDAHTGSDYLPPYVSSSYQVPAAPLWGITPAIALHASIPSYEARPPSRFVSSPPSGQVSSQPPSHQLTSPQGTRPADALHSSDPSAYKARSPPNSGSTSLAARGSEVLGQSATRSVSRTKTSGKSVTSALDDSLRRLEALSASLLAMSSKAPVPLAAPKATAQPPTDTDKRQIGRHDDEGNFGSFDLSASSLLPPLNPNLPSPRPFRTIVVAHMPKKFRVRTFVESWAKRFGTAVRTEIDLRSGKALVEYARPSDAEAAFTSMRLRGEGKEHIRVYWYQGPATTLSPGASASVSTPQPPAEIEDGEIEEGEVVEHTVASVKSRRKKKGKKEKSTPVSQMQLAVPVVTTNAASSWSSTPASMSTKVPAIGGYPSNCTVPTPRPTLEERFSDAPVTLDGVWEEEMDLESDDDYRPERSLSPALVATTIEPSPEVMDVEDWEADMDVEVSSPVREVESRMPAWASRGDTFAEPLQRPLKRPRSPSLDAIAPPRPGPSSALVEARRSELEVAIREQRTGPIASSSSSTVDSSSGISTTPEPATPSDWSVDISVAVATAVPLVVEIDGREANDPSVLVKDDRPAFDFDKLAESFITESIQAVNMSVAQCDPRSPASPAIVRSPVRPILPSPPLRPPAELSTLPSRLTRPARQPPAISSVLPATSTSKVSSPSTTPSFEATQLLAKKNRLEQYIATTRSLLAKVQAAKTKEEKDSLMRILKEKQRAMDAELPGVAALPSTMVARVATVTPTPTSQAKPFRWPETPREVIIEVTDDEPERAVSSVVPAHR